MPYLLFVTEVAVTGTVHEPVINVAVGMADEKFILRIAIGEVPVIHMVSARNTWGADNESYDG